eukprot:ANDGO_03120.mRNA.1 E3 SUMO-protein ligase pli1
MSNVVSCRFSGSDFLFYAARMYHHPISEEKLAEALRAMYLNRIDSTIRLESLKVIRAYVQFCTGWRFEHSTYAKKDLILSDISNVMFVEDPLWCFARNAYAAMYPESTSLDPPVIAKLLVHPLLRNVRSESGAVLPPPATTTPAAAATSAVGTLRGSSSSSPPPLGSALMDIALSSRSISTPQFIGRRLVSSTPSTPDTSGTTLSFSSTPTNPTRSQPQSSYVIPSSTSIAADSASSRTLPYWNLMPNRGMSAPHAPPSSISRTPASLVPTGHRASSSTTSRPATVAAPPSASASTSASTSGSLPRVNLPVSAAIQSLISDPSSICAYPELTKNFTPFHQTERVVQIARAEFAHASLSSHPPRPSSTATLSFELTSTELEEVRGNAGFQVVVSVHAFRAGPQILFSGLDFREFPILTINNTVWPLPLQEQPLVMFQSKKAQQETFRTKCTTPTLELNKGMLVAGKNQVSFSFRSVLSVRDQMSLIHNCIFVIRVVKLLPIEVLLSKIPQHNFPAAQQQRRDSKPSSNVATDRIPPSRKPTTPNDDDSDSDIEVVSWKIPTTDPLSSSRIERPARGIDCAHKACFDAKWFLLNGQNTGVYECPICKQAVHFHDIRYDTNFERILKQISPNARDVLVDSDGNIIPETAPSQRSTPSKRERPEGSASTPGSLGLTLGFDFHDVCDENPSWLNDILEGFDAPPAKEIRVTSPHAVQPNAPLPSPIVSANAHTSARFTDGPIEIDD